MTDAKMNAKIAELCGWKRGHTIQWTEGCVRHYDWGWTKPDGTPQYHAVPSYTTDLNACHELEKMLNSNELVAYLDALDAICVPVHICPTTHTQALVMATARQRCEAFLKIKGVTL